MTHNRRNYMAKPSASPCPGAPPTTGVAGVVASPTATSATAQEMAMKELAADESLSGEARESAKKAVEVLTSSQLLNIEQTADLKKMESEHNVALKKLESKSQFKRKKLEVEARVEMADWLAQHRLSNVADSIVRIAGANALPSELQYLTAENVTELGSSLTNIEELRLRATLQGLREEGGSVAPEPEPEPEPEASRS